MIAIFKKYKTLSVVARATLWFLASMFIQKGIAFITVPIFTRMMPTEQYGLYNTYLSVLHVLTTVCTMKFETCAFVNCVAKEKSEKKHNEMAVNLITLSTLITLCISALYYAFRNSINAVIGLTTPMMLFAFVEILFILPVSFWSYKQRFAYKYVKLVCITLCMSIINTACGMIFVWISQPQNRAISRIFSVALIQVVFGFSFYLFFVLKTKKFFVCKNWGSILKIHIPLLPHNLSMNILFSADKVMINALVGAKETAIYSVAYSAGMVMQLIKTCIIDAIKPWIYNKLKTKCYEDIEKALNKILVIVAISSVCFSIFSPEIVRVLAPKEYYGATYAIPPVACSAFLIFVYDVLVCIETYYEKTKNIMFASVFASVINIFLNLLFVPVFGYIAAGYTTLFSYLVLTVFHYLNVRKIQNQDMNGSNILNFKRFLMVSIITIFIIIGFIWTFNMPIIRYGALLIVIICTIVLREKLLRAIKVIITEKRG